MIIPGTVFSFDTSLFFLYFIPQADHPTKISTGINLHTSLYEGKEK